MKGKPKKSAREKNITSRFLSGGLDEDRLEQQERFGDKSKHYQRRKTEKTALMRAAEDSATAIDLDTLPVGDVITVHSLFCEIESGGVINLCVTRKTMASVAGSAVVTGDRVRFRPIGTTDDQGRPEGVVEQVLPRRSLLTRADSFKAIESHPIVANADQVLIVAALSEPWPKWGLIDRMLIAARAGGLAPIVCLNKLDLTDTKDGKREWEFAQAALAHYATIGVVTLQTSIIQNLGIDELRGVLAGKTTVLAGHSGVGKSSLVNAVQPHLDIRVGDISGYTGKGRHTTTSARRYSLGLSADGGPGAPATEGYVIDTPGVKLFGLWNVRRENLEGFFPDVAAGTAPDWRRESFERILESLSK